MLHGPRCAAEGMHVHVSGERNRHSSATTGALRLRRPALWMSWEAEPAHKRRSEEKHRCGLRMACAVERKKEGMGSRPADTSTAMMVLGSTESIRTLKGSRRGRQDRQ